MSVESSSLSVKVARSVFRLPDLPNVGYATHRERTGTDQIMTFMRDVERNRLRLLTIVIEGRERWRKVARAVFGSTMSITDDVLDDIYNYFTLQAARPEHQRELLDAAQNPPVWRDIVTRIMPDIEAQRETVRLVQKWQP